MSKSDASDGKIPPLPERLRAIQAQWRIYGLINEWIRFADAKAGALLAANALILVSAVAAFKDHKQVFNDHMWLTVFGVLGLGSLIASAICCLWCIFPRIRMAEGTSPIFFGHISQHSSPDDYQKKAGVLGDEDQEFAEISDQVWRNAKIAHYKHVWIAFGVAAFAVGLIVSLVVGSYVAFT